MEKHGRQRPQRYFMETTIYSRHVDFLQKYHCMPSKITQAAPSILQIAMDLVSIIEANYGCVKPGKPKYHDQISSRGEFHCVGIGFTEQFVVSWCRQLSLSRSSKFLSITRPQSSHALIPHTPSILHTPSNPHAPSDPHTPSNPRAPSILGNKIRVEMALWRNF